MFGDVWNQAYNTQHSEPNIVKHRRHVCLSHAELGAGVAVVVQRLAITVHTKTTKIHPFPNILCLSK